MKAIAGFFYLLLMMTASMAGYTQNNTASLLKQIAHSANDSNKVKLLREVALSLDQKDNKKAFQYVQEALALAEKLNDTESRVQSHRVLRQLYQLNNNTAMALQQGIRILDLYKETGNKSMIAKSYYQVGASYFTMADYSNALSCYFEALKIYEKLNDKFQQGVLLNSIGNIHTELNDFKNALSFLTRSRQLAVEIKDSIGMALLDTDIGILYSHQHKHDEAIASFTKGISMLEFLKDTGELINALNNLGVTYKKAGRYGEALKSYQLSYYYMLLRNPQDAVGIAKMKSNIGIVYVQLKNYEMAEQYLNEAIAFAKRFNNLPLLKENYEAYYELSKFKGDYKTALDYQLLYRSIADSLFNLQKSAQINELQIKYEAEKKDHKISQLKQENKVNEAELGKQKILKNAFIAGFMLIFLLVIVLYNRYNVRQKTQRELEIKNNALEHALENLHAAQAQLIQSEKMASLGQLTAGIAHEIKNPLNFINNFAEVSGELIKEYQETEDDREKSVLLNDLVQNITKISEHGKRADSIVSGMLSHSRTHAAEKEPTDVNKLCEEFFNLAYHSMRANFPEFNCEMKKELTPLLPKVNMVAQDISRVLLNLVSNAFYAVKEKAKKTSAGGKSNYKPEVRIITEKNSEFVTVHVYDNGTGIPDAVREKIFTPFFTTKPTGEGTGLGLSLSFDIVKAHGGFITLTSKPGEYTSFQVSLPV